MNIIIVGCGRVGSRLAALFSEGEDDVTVIDTNVAAFGSLKRDFEGRTIVGVGFDEDVLLKAGVEEADVLAAVTNVDNTNLMIAEVGRKLFGVPHVITRLYNPDRENAYLQLGIDYVCGTALEAEEMYTKIMAGHSSHVYTVGDYEILSFSLDLEEREVNSIRVSDMEREHEVRIVAFQRKDGSQSSIPTYDSVLHNGDIVVACVHKDLLEHFARFMRK